MRTLCMTLAYVGCRLSEALAVTADRVDLAAGVLVFKSLKKRRSGIFRSVPVPPPGSMHSIWCRASANGTPAWQRSRVRLALVADDRLAGSACGDADASGGHSRWSLRPVGAPPPLSHEICSGDGARPWRTFPSPGRVPDPRHAHPGACALMKAAYPGQFA
jgi:hypothetical protein